MCYANPELLDALLPCFRLQLLTSLPFVICSAVVYVLLEP